MTINSSFEERSRWYLNSHGGPIDFRETESFARIYVRLPKNLPMRDEGFLSRKLEERRAQDALRRLRLPEGKVDLCSNDYLGVVRNGLLRVSPEDAHGSGGSRLLAGNYALVEETELAIAAFQDRKSVV